MKPQLLRLKCQHKIIKQPRFFHPIYDRFIAPLLLGILQPAAASRDGLVAGRSLTVLSVLPVWLLPPEPTTIAFIA